MKNRLIKHAKVFLALAALLASTSLMAETSAYISGTDGGGSYDSATMTTNTYESGSQTNSTTEYLDDTTEIDGDIIDAATATTNYTTATTSSIYSDSYRTETAVSTTTEAAYANTSTTSGTIDAAVSALKIMVISPSTGGTYTGNYFQFKALSEWGSQISATWSASAGSIDRAGLYKAPSYTGVFYVTAKAEGYRDATAAISVIAAAPTQTSLSPETTYVAPAITDDASAEATSNEPIVYPIYASTTTVNIDSAATQTTQVSPNTIKAYEPTPIAPKTIPPSVSQPYVPPTAADPLYAENKVAPTSVRRESAELLVLSTALDELRASDLDFTRDIRASVEEALEKGEISEKTAEDIVLLYKDTNKDGVSDYESITVFNIDPLAPPTETAYEGGSMSVEEKILQGYDPAASGLVKIAREEPVASFSPITNAYSVEDIRLDEDKSVVFTGSALPNSFITLYIYSTPVIVVVKADEYGKWEYTLDKELPSGEHTIYAATVNNTGKILVRSSAIPFVKTAEAATLDTSLYSVSSDQKPGLLDTKDLMAITVVFLGLLFGAINIIGMNRRKAEASEKADP